VRLSVLLALIVLSPLSGADHLAKARVQSRDYQVRLQTLITSTTDEDINQAIIAIRELVDLQDPQVVPTLLARADHLANPPRVAATAMRALARMDVQTAIPVLAGLTRHDNPTLRHAATSGLIDLGQLSNEDLLVMMDDPEPAIRGTAAVILGKPPLTAETSARLQQAMLRDNDSHVRRMAAFALAHHGGPDQAKALTDALTDASLPVRRLAAAGLGRLKHQAALPELLMAMESGLAVDDMHAAVVAISGQDFGYQPGDGTVKRHTAVERAFHWYSTQLTQR